MKQKKVLVTGGAGFIGSNLVHYLQKRGYEIVIFDKLPKVEEQDYANNIHYVQGNINSKKDLDSLFNDYGSFDTVFHLAAHMPDKSVSNSILWETNVTGTVNLISKAVKKKVKSFVFTSSNVAYGIPKILPVTEETPLNPIEIYGESKKRAEEELKKFKEKIEIQIFRCPVVSGSGRLGLAAILFEFVSENKNIYVLGDGSNKYQFADVIGVCDGLEKAGKAKGFDIYNIGADEVLSLKELYSKLIQFAKSSSKIVSLPKAPSLYLLSILDKLNISPLGIYQYTMIGRSLYMDTSKLKKKLRWQSRKTNLDTFTEGYEWYTKNKGNFSVVNSGDASSNRSLPKLGVFALLKMFS